MSIRSCRFFLFLRRSVCGVQIIFGVFQFCENFVRLHFGNLCTKAAQRAASLHTWRLGDRGHRLTSTTMNWLRTKGRRPSPPFRAEPGADDKFHQNMLGVPHRLRLAAPPDCSFTLRDPEWIAVYNSGSRHTFRRVQRVELSDIECDPPESKATGVPLPMHGTGALLSHGCMVQQHRMPNGSSACESPSMYSLKLGVTCLCAVIGGD